MIARSLAALGFLTSCAVPVFGQGSLTPPAGPPAPVYKTLDQVEARTPLVAGQPGVSIDANGGITISQPGSYYLTGNRTVTTGNGIAITADHVTVDLNGFALASTSTTNVGSGILVSNRDNIVITNGHIYGSVTNISASSYVGNGFLTGVNAESTMNIRVDRLTVSGCKQHGILLATPAFFNASASSCSVRQVGLTGISAGIVEGCTVSYAGNTAISGTTVVNCMGHSTNGTAIFGDMISNSRGIGSDKGIQATASVTNCTGESTVSGPGIVTVGTATHCRGKSATAVAIDAGIAIGCTTAGGVISSPQKHLGTP